MSTYLYASSWGVAFCTAKLCSGRYAVKLYLLHLDQILWPMEQAKYFLCHEMLLSHLFNILRLNFCLPKKQNDFCCFGQPLFCLVN